MNREELRFTYAELLKLAKDREEIEFDLADFDELISVIPNLKGFKEFKLYVSADSEYDSIKLNLYCEGTCLVVDNHKFNVVELPFSGESEAIVSENKDETDIDPEGGKYDLYQVILPLLYDVIPTNYSSEDIDIVENSEYTLMSDGEYEKRKNTKKLF